MKTKYFYEFVHTKDLSNDEYDGLRIHLDSAVSTYFGAAVESSELEESVQDDE